MDTRILLGILLLSASGCGTNSPDPDPDSLFERDELPEYFLDSSPALVLGGPAAEGPSAFFEVQGARFLPTGEIVVVDGSTEELRFFDLEGGHQRTTGGRGHGPGEFQAINWIGLSGKNLLAWDIQILRLSILDFNGKVLETVPFDLSQARAIRPTLLGALADGSLLLRDAGGSSPEPAVREWEDRDSVEYLLVEPGGTGLRILQKTLGAEVFHRTAERSKSRVDVLFGRNVEDAVTQDFLFYGLTDSLTLVRFDPWSQEVIRRTFPWSPTPVGIEDIKAERQVRVRESEALFARMGRQIQIPDADRLRIAGAREEAVAEVPNRGTLPAFGYLLPDSSGNLWVSEATSPLAEDRRWIVFDPELVPIARIQLPNSWVILDISPPFILTIEKDDLGVETVVSHRYSMHPAPERGPPEVPGRTRHPTYN